MPSSLFTVSTPYRAPQARPRRGSACWVATLLALVLTGRTSALSPDRNLTEYTLSTWQEGLPQNTVLALALTPDGYLWLGTYEGLARFDGIRFVVYEHHGTPALGDANEIFDLVVDRRGRLWVGSSTSLSKLEAGRFEKVLGPDSLAGEPVRALADADDGLWVGTSGQLLRLDANGALVRTWKVGTEIPNSVIRTLLTDPLGGLWVGFESGELMRLLDDRIEIFRESDGLPRRPLLALANGRDGELWIGTEGGGLLRRLGTSVTRFGIEDGLTDVRIRSLYVDPHNVLWIGTDGGGINRFSDGQFSALTSTNGMPSDLVRSMIQDRDGGLWIGTNGGGVAALRESRFSSFDRRDGLDQDNIRSVLEDQSGAVWIGTDGSGLYRLRGQELTHFGVEAGLPSAFVRSIHEDRQRRLWVGTNGAGLSRFDGERFVSLTTRDGLLSDNVYVIQDDSEGALWVGTDRGLNRVGGNGSIADFTPAEGLAGEQVTDILESSRGGLWVATVGGLNWIATGGVTAFTAQDGLASSRVFSLFEDHDGTLWVGTNQGLSQYRNGVFRTVTTQHGLANNVIFSILDDGLGRFWMTSNQGVFSVSRRELSDVLEGRAKRVASHRYDRADGLGANQCNGLSQPAAWQTRDGRLLFPTVRGVAMLDPAAVIRNELAPLVVIEEMIVDTDKIPLGGRISLDPGRGERIEFAYTGVSFRSPERVRFRYQLQGMDLDWIEAEDRRVAYYTNIPPGNYRFRVIAVNGDGVWNEVGDSIAFEILPFFYQTSWFPWAISLLVLALGWSAHRWRLLRIEAQHQQLALLVEARTDELAKATRELQRLSLTDGLTGAANRRRFDQMLGEEWMRARRRAEPLSLLMIDIDYFKRYNDTCGHQQGDEVLKQLTAQLQASARRTDDLVARYGGEEFVIVAPRLESEEAERHAERIRKRVEQVAIPHPSSSISERVTVSVGVATLRPIEGGSTEELVLRADEALYRAKRRGRNRIARAGPTAPPSSHTSL